MLRAARLAAGAQARAARGAAARGNRSRRPDRARRRRGAARAASSARRRSSSSTSSGSSSAPTPAAPRAATGRCRAAPGAGRAAARACCARTSCAGSRAGSSCPRAPASLLAGRAPERPSARRAAAQRRAGHGGARAGRPTTAVRAERTFLVLCIVAAGRRGDGCCLDRPRAAADQRASPPRRPHLAGRTRLAAGRPAARRRAARATGRRPRRARRPRRRRSAPISSSTPAWCSSWPGSSGRSAAPGRGCGGIADLAREREQIREAIRATVARSSSAPSDGRPSAPSALSLDLVRGRPVANPRPAPCASRTTRPTASASSTTATRFWST